MTKLEAHTILINPGQRFYKTKTSLALHKLVFKQWHKELDIRPCSYGDGWEIIKYDKIYSTPVFFKTINQINEWLQQNFNFTLIDDAIKHLEKIESKFLMRKILE